MSSDSSRLDDEEQSNAAPPANHQNPVTPNSAGDAEDVATQQGNHITSNANNNSNGNL